MFFFSLFLAFFVHCSYLYDGLAFSWWFRLLFARNPNSNNAQTSCRFISMFVMIALAIAYKANSTQGMSAYKDDDIWFCINVFIYREKIHSFVIILISIPYNLHDFEFMYLIYIFSHRVCVWINTHDMFWSCILRCLNSQREGMFAGGVAWEVNQFRADIMGTNYNVTNRLFIECTPSFILEVLWFVKF